MARKRRDAESSGRTILLVDDSEAYLTTARRIIERDGHEVLTASSGREGLGLLATRDVDLVLVDYLMPGMTGEEFIREMRRTRPSTQVILQTGYADEHPPRELLRRLDIQGFHDKSDGPEKLALWVDVGLKAAYAFGLLHKSRHGLRYILDATPSLHRMQPLADLLQGVLLQTAGLLGIADSFVASLVPASPTRERHEGFVAIGQEEGDLALRAATGRFRDAARIEEALDPGGAADVHAALAGSHVQTTPDCTIAPLRVGERTIGVVYVDRAVHEEWERELLEVLANQAAVAIHNVSLYEMAALDSLTGVATRRFFDQAMIRELRAATRSGAPMGLLVIDVDDMKGLNDGMGHAAGDCALAALGTALRRAVRSTDIVGRIGGDEFAVLLPSTDEEGTQVVLHRVREELSCLRARQGANTFEVSASLGAALFAASALDVETVRRGAGQLLERTAVRLFEAADAAMYRTKRDAEEGGIAHVSWVVPPRASIPATRASP